jgi:hypothetical protein
VRLLLAVALWWTCAAQAQSTFTVRVLTPEMALKAA